MRGCCFGFTPDYTWVRYLSGRAHLRHSVLDASTKSATDCCNLSSSVSLNGWGAYCSWRDAPRCLDYDDDLVAGLALPRFLDCRIHPFNRWIICCWPSGRHPLSRAAHTRYVLVAPGIPLPNVATFKLG